MKEKKLRKLGRIGLLTIMKSQEEEIQALKEERDKLLAELQVYKENEGNVQRMQEVINTIHKTITLCI